MPASASRRASSIEGATYMERMTAWSSPSSEGSPLPLRPDLCVEFHPCPDPERRRLPVARLQSKLGRSRHGSVGGDGHPERRVGVLVGPRRHSQLRDPLPVLPCGVRRIQGMGEDGAVGGEAVVGSIGTRSTRWSRSPALSPPSPGRVPCSPYPCEGPRWDETADPRTARLPCRSQPRRVRGSGCRGSQRPRRAVSDATTERCSPSARCESGTSAPRGPRRAESGSADRPLHRARSGVPRATSPRSRAPRPESFAV